MIGALVLILGVECFINDHKSVMMGDSVWTYEVTRRLASHDVKDCGVLILGDSLISHGISAKVIRQETGLKGYNLSFSGSQAPGSYFLLREALESGAKPKFVIVDYFPRLLDSDSWFNITNLPTIASPAECIELAYLQRDSNLLGSLLLRKALPSILCRESIRDSIVQNLGGQGFDLRTHRLTLERNRAFNRGLVIAPNRADPNTNYDDFISYLFPYFHCNDVNRAYIDRFMKLAKAHDVSVVLLMPPYIPLLQSKLEARGFDAKHQQFIESLVATYPNLCVLDGRKTNFEPNLFIDMNHLAYEGAKLFSAEIGEILRGKLEGSPEHSGRWIVMKPYRSRIIDVPHETYEESRVAVLKGNRL